MKGVFGLSFTVQITVCSDSAARSINGENITVISVNNPVYKVTVVVKYGRFNVADDDAVRRMFLNAELVDITFEGRFGGLDLRDLNLDDGRR